MYLCLIYVIFNICSAFSAAVEAPTSVLQAIKISSQDEDYKCPSLRTSKLFKNTPEFLNNCPNFNSAKSIDKVTDKNIDEALCILYFNNFEYLCYLAKGGKDLVKIADTIPDSFVKDIHYVCRTLIENQHFVKIAKPGIDTILKILPDKCSRMCTDLDENIKPICSLSAYFADISASRKGSDIKKAESATTDEPAKLNQGPSPALSQKQTLMKDVNEQQDVETQTPQQHISLPAAALPDSKEQLHLDDVDHVSAQNSLKPKIDSFKDAQTKNTDKLNVDSKPEEKLKETSIMKDVGIPKLAANKKPTLAESKDIPPNDAVVNLLQKQNANSAKEPVSNQDGKVQLDVKNDQVDQTIDIPVGDKQESSVGAMHEDITNKQSKILNIPPSQQTTQSVSLENSKDDLNKKIKVEEVLKPSKEGELPPPVNENDEVSEEIDLEAGPAGDGETDYNNENAPKFSEVKAKSTPEVSKSAEKLKPLHTEEDHYSSISANYQNQSIDDSDSYFFSYFMMFCIIFICGYVAYHNKQKILALVVEGRRGRRPSRSRRPNSANYHKLDSNLEEAITSTCNKKAPQVIY